MKRDPDGAARGIQRRVTEIPASDDALIHLPSLRFGEYDEEPVLDRLPAGTGVMAVVAVLALLTLDHGGISTYSWGWATIVLAGLAIGMVALRGKVEVPARIELLPLAGLWGLVAWSGLSAFWGSAGPSINEAERLLLYAVLATALAVALRKRTIEILVVSLVAMTGVVDVVALWAKLVNVHYSASGAARVNRLQTPFEYWNALGIFGVIGFLLALGLVFENVRREVRIAAAGTLPATALVVYFTFSRGSIFALGIGLLVLVVAPPDRLRRIGITGLLATPTLLLLLFATRQSELIRHQPSATHPHRLHRWLVHATSEAHDTILILTFAIVACCIAVELLPRIQDRITISATVRRRLTIGVAGVVVLGIVGVLALKGSPLQSGLGPLESPPPSSYHDLNNRLASVSLNGRGRFWDAAWSDFLDHPLQGSGGGTFVRYWLEHRTVPADISDAHSFVLQTLAELGLVGLLLLGCVLVPPFVAAWRARRQPMVPLLAAGLVAFVVHAATDRDWETPAVACFALCLVVALCLAAAPERQAAMRANLRWALAGGLAVVCLLATWTFAGNAALSRARADLASGHLSTAQRDARLASDLAPWSPGGPIALGRVAVASHDSRAAGQRFLQATQRDPDRWFAWWQLSQYGPQSGRAAALARARHLNPLAVAQLENPSQ